MGLDEQKKKKNDDSQIKFFPLTSTNSDSPHENPLKCSEPEINNHLVCTYAVGKCRFNNNHTQRYGVRKIKYGEIGEFN